MAKPVRARVAAPRQGIPPDHAAGFNSAIEKAVQAFAKEHEPGTYTVDVDLFAVVQVVNPGTIQQYGAKVTQQGGGGGR
jgi:hypothetical protein